MNRRLPTQSVNRDYRIVPIKRRLAVLASGGLDSSVMLAELARGGREVFPVYVRAGLMWERHELGALRSYIRGLKMRGIHAVSVLQLPMGDLTTTDVVPPDGFYTRAKISLNSPTWAYLVLPLSNDSLIEDDGEGLEETDEGFESPVPVGVSRMQAILREQADQSRSRKKQETVRRKLRDSFSGGDIALVRFRLVEDRLEWDVTPQNSITAN